jgi:type II secretion system (T2SS) protein E
MTLSSLIVQHEVATMRQVEEALARQVIYGGDLATNLLEVASVDEAALTQLIAEAMRLAPAPAGELPVALGPAQLVPPEIATARGIVPLTLEGEILVLAVIEPLSTDVEEQLMFALGVAIEQRAAPAVRVQQAIMRLYGQPLDRRMQRLVARLSGQPVPSGDGTPPPGAIRAAPGRPPAPSLGTSKATAPTPPLGSPVARIALTTEAGGSPPAPAPSTPRRRRTAPGFPAAAPPALESSPPSTPVVPERRGGLLQRDIPMSARSTRRRRGPIPLDTAGRDAEEATDADALLDLFFDFARQFFDYTALFLVHGDIAEGRDAFGAGAARERVAGIGVPLDLPSLMSNARDERASVIAVAPADGLDAALLADLQRPRDAEMAIVPLVVKRRAVALLLGDCGDAGVERPGLEPVIAFAVVVGKALERVIVRRKREGSVPVAKAARDVGEFGGEVEEPSPRRRLEGSSAAPVEAASSSAPDLGAPPGDVPSPRAQTLVPTTTMPPPPPNVAIVRKITGPPIPREEPEERAIARDRAPASLDLAAPEAADAPWPAVDEPPTGQPIPAELDSQALFDMLGWETGSEEPEIAPPSSALALPPHRPPIPHITPSEPLPSVIVDMDQELAVIVDRVVSGDADESAEAELLRQGERAMRVIMARFPGPLIFDRAHLASATNPPRASECGPLLRLVARQRRVALPFVLERLSDPDPDTRGWATYLLSELPYAEAIPHALARLHDPDAFTRALAFHAVAAVAKAFPDPMREAMKALARADDAADRACAMRAIAQLRQPVLVPELVGALADEDGQVTLAARDALVQVTCQDFGSDARPWLKWWGENASRHRIEWLIDSLTHDVSEIRLAAGEDLRAITREYFGSSSDLPPRDRDRAQQRYRDWWITEGRTRFRRR